MALMQRGFIGQGSVSETNLISNIAYCRLNRNRYPYRLKQQAGNITRLPDLLQEHVQNYNEIGPA